MGQIVCAVSGVNGQLEVENDRIRIKRAGLLGFLTQGLKGDKEIQLSSITSIQFKEAGTMFNGYIQFAFIGGQETKSGIYDAAGDENTVMFNRKQMPDFVAAKKSIEQLRDRLTKPSVQTSPDNSLDQLEKLAALRDKGIVSEEEFAAKKKQLLGL